MLNYYKYIFIIFILLIFNLNLNATIKKDWTILIFLNADNDLEYFGIKDINEMEKGFIDNSNVNVIVQLDRYIGPQWDDTSNGNWTDCRRYMIKHDEDENIINSELLEEIGEVNMGDAETLKDFIKYGVTNFPANHYLLVLWNHGAGWVSYYDNESRYKIVKSVSIDYEAQDELTLKELYNALNYFYNLTGKRLDILGFDACLMQMIEVGYEIAPFVYYIAASELTEGGDGWEYETLIKDICKNHFKLGVKGIAQKIAYHYHKSYNGSPNYSATYSIINAKKLPTIMTLLNKFTLSLINYFPLLNNTLNIIDGVQSFWDTKEFNIHNKYIDLAHLAQKIYEEALASPLIPETLEIVINAKMLFDNLTNDNFGTIENELKPIEVSHSYKIRFYYYKDPDKKNRVIPNKIKSLIPYKIIPFNQVNSNDFDLIGPFEIIEGNPNLISCPSNCIGISPLWNDYIIKNQYGYLYGIKLIPNNSKNLFDTDKKLYFYLNTSIKGYAYTEHAIVANYHYSCPNDANVDNAKGLSIYFPEEIYDDINNITKLKEYRSLRFSNHSLWDEFIITYLTDERIQRKLINYEELANKINNYNFENSYENKIIIEKSFNMEIHKAYELGKIDMLIKLRNDFKNQNNPLIKNLENLIKKYNFIKQKSGR